MRFLTKIENSFLEYKIVFNFKNMFNKLLTKKYFFKKIYYKIYTFKNKFSGKHEKKKINVNKLFLDFK